MPVIDSDAHVLENEHTWDYLDPSDQKYRPALVSLPEGSTGRLGVSRESWVIDGKIRGLRFPSLSEQELQARSDQIGRNVMTTVESREMQDVSIRLKHMDGLGIDMEVLHNTLFIETVADRPQVDVPICRAWNRWVADIWKQGEGRLRWTCVPPVTSIPDALDVIRFSKEHGAVGVILRPIEGNRMVVDPYFYPIFEEAQRLNMTMVVHIANANTWFNDLYNTPFDPNGASFGRFMAPAVVVCHQLIMSELPTSFPTLRWAIVEAGAQWLPWVISEAERRFPTVGRKWPEEGFAAFRIYVTCQTNNDMAFILKHAGEDNLVIGTDYGHIDISSEVDAIEVFQKTSGVDPRVYKKIVDDNARAAWGL